MKSYYTHLNGHNTIDLIRRAEVVRFDWTDNSNIVDINIMDSDPSNLPIPVKVSNKKEAREYWKKLIAWGYRIRVRHECRTE